MRHYLMAGLLLALAMPIVAQGYSIQDAENDLRELQFERVRQNLNPDQFDAAEDKAYAFYLLGAAAFDQEKYDEALTIYEKLSANHPQSRWFVKARYRQADCLMFLKKYAEAEAIYAAGAGGLLSDARRSEIADIYIHHADRFFAPEKKNQPPSYEQARALYERACEILPKGPAWERASYQISMTHYLMNQWKEAQQKLQELILYYRTAEPSTASVIDAPTSGKIPNPYLEGGYLDQALLKSGEASFQMGDKIEARRVWKKLRDADGKNSKHPEIIAEASYKIAKTYGVPEPENDKDLWLGARTIDEYISLFPNHENVPLAALEKAKANFHRRQFDKALEAAQTMLQQYAKRATPPQSAAAEFLIARCLLEQEKFDEAIKAFETFLANHPVDENWREAQQSIVYTRYRKVESLQRRAEKELARWMRDRRQENKSPSSESIPESVLESYKTARGGWDSFQQAYPLDGRVPNILVQLGKNERALRRYEEAIALWKDLASRYPQSDQASNALFLIAETTEKELDDQEKAIDQYKEITFGSYQGQAQERIRQLQAISLTIATERVFRTDEKPAARVTLRNIEKIECKLYPLDLPAYFQSQHTIRNVENLDVNLIAPSKVWTATPENYRPYKEISLSIPITIQGPGAWAIQVESETLQGTALLIVSDLAAAIKGGKDEIFVYAEDQRAEQTVEGAEIFVSDGKSIIAQGKTNKDGVFHARHLKALEANQLSVFASYDGNWTGESLDIQNTSPALPMQPRAQIYCDRSVYQPGEEVNYRALVREIEEGRYAIPSEFEYVIAAVDSRGTTIYKQTSRLSEFGTIHGEFALDESAPLGTYQLAISRKDGPSYAITFEIKEFTLPTARIEIETQKKTYYYGDIIEGIIRLSDFSGNPLPGEKIVYALNGLPQAETRDGVANEKGEIEFRFEIWDAPEEGVLFLTAQAPSRQIQSSKQFILVNTGFTISLETVRNVYLVDEPFQVAASAFSREEKREKLKTPLKISLQRKNDEGAFATVEERIFTTSEKANVPASVSFTAKTGGNYRILAEGTDSRGTAITEQKDIFISGENDDNKLLILNDRSRCQQGETVEFTVVSRLPDNLCLITGEREGVVEYRVIQLKKGKNVISWKMDERYSPSAVISVMAMSDNRFYSRDVSFEVHRGLDVAITPNAESYSPRGEAEFLIEIRDHTGVPAMAEFSLSLVDAAFLALYPNYMGISDEYFQQAGQGRTLPAVSSADFKYEGAVRPISEELLAEAAKKLDEDLLLDKDKSKGLRAGRELRRRSETAAALSERGLELPAEPPTLAMKEASPELKADFADAAGLLSLGNRPVSQKRYEAEGVVRALKAPSDHYVGYYFAKYAYPGGSPIQIRKDFPISAYFNAAIITDEKGQAKVRIPLPDSLTTWEAQAIAVTKDTLINQAEKNIVVDKSYRVELETPDYLVEGDQSSGLAVIRNNTGQKQSGHTAFTQIVAGRPYKIPWQDSLEPSGIHKQTVPLIAEAAGDATLTLESRAPQDGDAVRKTLSILPYGVPIRTGKSGVANDNAVIDNLSLPSKVDYSRIAMWIGVSGAGDISLLRPAWTQEDGAFSTRAQIEKGLAALAAWECGDKVKKNAQVPMELLKNIVDASTRRAIASQTDQGLWAWGGGREAAPDITTTGRAIELLQRARQRGFNVPDKIFEATLAQLAERYQQTSDDGEKARILYAWSLIQAPDFTFVNRIHRNLARLDAFDASLLGLTWFNMGRSEKAVEALNQLLESPDIDNSNTEREGKRESPAAKPAYFASRQEIVFNVARIYFLLPPSIRTEKQTQRFLAELTADSIQPLREAAPPLGVRMQALSAYLQSAAEETEAFALTINVNGQKALQYRSTQSVFPYQQINIDPSWIKLAGNRIEFLFNGKGRCRYSVVLEGWTKQDVKPQDWIDPQDRLFANVYRKYEHGPMTYKNLDIPRGYSVVDGSYQSVNNQLEEVAAGDRINIRLQIDGRRETNYLIVEDRIPAGFFLEKNSVRGPVDRCEQQGNTLVFYLRGPYWNYTIDYQLRARFAGTYRAAPAFMTTAEKPEQLYATDSQSIAVLPEGEKPKREYNPTPDEMYYLGAKFFDDKDYEPAKRYLTMLFNNYSLCPEPYLDTARKLFQIHLQGGEAKELVRYFEIIKERDKEFEIQFAQIGKLAQAYRDIGECERAVYVYRSLLDGLFLQEGAVSGTLQEVNRYRESLDYRKQLIMEYPDISSVQTAVYSTGTIIYQNVDQWAKEANFVQSGYTKKDLLAEAVGMIESFMALYPRNPMADEAGYTLLNLWLDQKNFAAAAQLAQAFAKRFTASAYLDSFDYLAAYAEFQLEQYPQALELAQKVSTQDYPAPGGGLRKSEEANTAILMAGKILHAAGDFDRALEQYERVKESFGDAVLSLDHLTEKGLTIEDVETFHGADPASIALRHKNLDAADLRVYKVDLMKFYLSERDLERMTRINLAGIRPIAEKTLDWKSAKKFEWNESKIDLPLNDPGAYLVVLSGNGLLTSGMVLRSDLDVEVQEDAAQGVVRVNAQTGQPPKLAKDVKIQVRGSRNDKFITGETDLRGIFTAEDVKGAVTVLAQLGDQYGFYRGTQELGPPPEAAGKPIEKMVQQVEELARPMTDIDALGNNFSRLQQVQQRQIQLWNDATNPMNNRVMTQKANSLY